MELFYDNINLALDQDGRVNCHQRILSNSHFPLIYHLFYESLQCRRVAKSLSLINTAKGLYSSLSSRQESAECACAGIFQQFSFPFAYGNIDQLLLGSYFVIGAWLSAGNSEIHVRLPQIGAVLWGEGQTCRPAIEP